jgi:hypothetical protein
MNTTTRHRIAAQDVTVGTVIDWRGERLTVDLVVPQPNGQRVGFGVQEQRGRFLLADNTKMLTAF